MQQINHVFYFHELNEEQKKKAAEYYQEKNQYNDEFSLECQEYSVFMKEQFAENEIIVEGLSWNSYPTIIEINRVDLTRMRDFCAKHNLKEEWELLYALEDFFDIDEYDLFDNCYERKNNFEFTCGLVEDESERMRFIMEFAPEEIKSKYELLHLMNQEVPENEEDEFDIDAQQVLEKLLEPVRDKIDGIISEVYNKIEKGLDEYIDYLGSAEYYYEELEARSEEDELIFDAEGQHIVNEDSELLQNVEARLIVLSEQDKERIENAGISFDFNEETEAC